TCHDFSCQWILRFAKTFERGLAGHTERCADLRPCLPALAGVLDSIFQPLVRILDRPLCVSNLLHRASQPLVDRMCQPEVDVASRQKLWCLWLVSPVVQELPPASGLPPASRSCLIEGW